MIQRGDLWWADFGEPRGSAPARRRPVVVVQAQSYNESRLRTVLVVSLTTNLHRASSPGNVYLPASSTGLPRDSVANVTQLGNIDRRHLDGPIGSLPVWLMDEVDRGLRRVLAL